MKRLFLVIFFLGFISAKAQIHEIGVFLGGGNYIGDVGKTNYISPNQPAFGLLYKWNKSPRHSYRFSFTMGKITGDDSKSDERARQKRGYSFENNIKELSAGMEFNFFDFNLHQFGQKVTPYVFTGICYTTYDELYVINGVTKTDTGSHTFAIPMTVGIKANITNSIILGLEAGVRYTFTDNLDGSNPKNENYQIYKFGNLDSNDWYVFTGITLTYTFGQKPCYCAD